MISLNSQGQDKCYQPKAEAKEEKSGFPGAVAKKYRFEGVNYRCEGKHAVRNRLYFKWLFFLIQEQRR